jgi:hypothetical protein
VAEILSNIVQNCPPKDGRSSWNSLGRKYNPCNKTVRSGSSLLKHRKGKSLQQNNTAVSMLALNSASRHIFAMELKIQKPSFTSR